MPTDPLHDVECTGWHPLEGGERRCMACNPDGEGPYGPPPWHTGDWKIDGVLSTPTTTPKPLSQLE